MFFIGIAMPGGIIESQFLFEHFNFIQAYTDLIINTVISSLQFIEINAWRNGLINIKTANGGVNIIYGCLAIGITCIWLSFVIALKNRLLNKLIWAIIGSLFLFALNIFRIGLILIVQENNTKHLAIVGLDHHTLFDIACYVLLLLMGFAYYKNSQP
jgi:exosortase/archaeosortase family protein